MHDVLEKKAELVKDRLHHHNVSEFEICFQSRIGQSIESSDGVKELSETRNSLGFALRLLKDKKIAFSYANDFSTSAIDDTILRCLESLHYFSKDEANAFNASFGSFDENQIQKFSDTAYDSLTQKTKEDFLHTLETSALEFDRRISAVKYASFQDEKEATLIQNSHGLNVYQERTLHHLSLMALATQDSETQSSYDMQSSFSLSELRPQDLGSRVAQDAVARLQAEQISNYCGPIIIRNNAAGVLLKALVNSFYADNIADNKSFLSDKRGKKVYSKSITIIDDVEKGQGSGSVVFDAEGCLTKKHVLVDEGQFKSLLTNSYWARRLGVPNSAHAYRKDLSQKISIFPHNCFVKSGAITKEDLVNKLQTGILVTHIMGGHMINTITGEASIGIVGFKIEKGQPVKSIRSMLLTGNLHEFYQNVTAVADDLKFYGCFGSGSLLINEANVCGS